MAEKRKFSALADFRQQPLDDEEKQASVPTAPIAAVPPPAPEPAKAKARPPGKRSNPEWKLYSHFLKKKTMREVAALLAEREDAGDLSDLLQEQLEKWLSKQKL